MVDVYLGLGSNLGDRREQLRSVLRQLRKAGVYIRRVSSLYETEPMYDIHQPSFLNAVVQAETELTPEELLSVAKALERDLGRRQRRRFGPREIDVDILLYGDSQRSSDELTIPHPRMVERPFVQVPLAELRDEPTAVGDGIQVVESPDWAADLVG